MEEVLHQLQCWLEVGRSNDQLQEVYGKCSSPAPMEEIVDLKLCRWPAAMEEVDDHCSVQAGRSSSLAAMEEIVDQLQWKK